MCKWKQVFICLEYRLAPEKKLFLCSCKIQMLSLKFTFCTLHFSFDAIIGTVLFKHFTGQKIFKRSLRNSDAFSETSSVSHCDDMEKMDQRSPTLSPGQEQRPLEPEKTELLPKVVPQATNKDTEDIQSSKSLNDCTSVEEQGSQR